MEGQVIPHMRGYATERTAMFNEHAAQHNFTEAERLLASASLRAFNEHFPDENLLDLDNLDATLNTARGQHTAQREAEEEACRAEEALNSTQEELEIERRERRNMGQRISDLELALEEARVTNNKSIEAPT